MVCLFLQARRLLCGTRLRFKVNVFPMLRFDVFQVKDSSALCIFRSVSCTHLGSLHPVRPFHSSCDPLAFILCICVRWHSNYGRIWLLGRRPTCASLGVLFVLFVFVASVVASIVVAFVFASSAVSSILFVFPCFASCTCVPCVPNGALFCCSRNALTLFLGLMFVCFLCAQWGQLEFQTRLSCFCM